MSRIKEKKRAGELATQIEGQFQSHFSHASWFLGKFQTSGTWQMIQRSHLRHELILYVQKGK